MYKPQLDLYSRALERIYGKPVTERWLHFLACGETVPVRYISERGMPISAIKSIGQFVLRRFLHRHCVAVSASLRFGLSPASQARAVALRRSARAPARAAAVLPGKYNRSQAFLR